VRRTHKELEIASSWVFFGSLKDFWPGSLQGAPPSLLIKPISSFRLQEIIACIETMNRPLGRTEYHRRPERFHPF